MRRQALARSVWAAVPLLPFLLLLLLLALPTTSAFIRGLEGIREPRRGDQPQPQWFTQLLDHFDGQEQRTWQQRYFINTQYWNPVSPGPIFFQVGGEGAIGPDYVTELQMVNYGKKWGALMVALEHRFYGPSLPLPDLSTQNLRYLSSEQALADAAVFITWLKQQYNSPDVPVITFGCSYPGNLAAWFRLKYPHITMASVASSSPVQATLDFYQYLDVVDKSLANFVGPQCDSLISQATTLINDMLATPGGKAKIEKMFNVCAPMQTDLDISTFYNNLMGNWMGVVQYNDENGNTVDMKYLCNIMESSPSSPLETYANISNLFLRLQGMSCMDNSYTDMITQLSNLTSPPTGVGARQWTYQTCTEFGYFQTTDSANQPFGSDVPLKYSLDMCNDLFGLGAGPNINGTNTIYGGNKFPAYTTSNILFVNGNVDPWHALGVTSAVSPSLPAILINGTAHCANVLPSRPDDPPSLQQAREQTQKQIDQWLTAAMGKKHHASIN